MIINNYRDIARQIEVTPEISNLVQLLRNLGLGQNITRQKFEATEQEHRILVDAIKLWDGLTHLIELRAMAKNDIRNFQKLLAVSLITGHVLSIVSVFCPSYKTGVDLVGYTGKLGSTTKFNLARLESINDLLRRASINTNTTVYFSDLMLENYQSLTGTSYRQDLDNNFTQLKIAAPNFDIHRLSSLGQLSSNLGEIGLVEGDLRLPTDIYQKMITRNKVFYAEKLGWSDHQVEQRTKTLALSYPVMSSELFINHPNAVLYWSESAWERSEMMLDLTLPIIYPSHD